eukprot:GILI01034139.1.p1 GENE.GILI01034139.1~~GILI01034139.1.p1  ORF type:complete len:328 (+),score=31.33 GILI01034139.1:71-985(+)
MLKQLAIPAVGFGIGWGGWDLMERYELVSPEAQQWLHLNRLKAQRGVKASLPEGAGSFLVRESVEDLDRAIANLSAPPIESVDNRLKFVEVLQQCRIQEQLEWMEEHAQEDIPFFFIADLFHAFAALHEPCLSSDEKGSDVLLVDDKKFASSILTQRTCEMMLSGVMPFDVAARVLAVLAVSNKANRITVASFQAQEKSFVEIVATKWQAYHDDLMAKGTPDGDGIVTSAQVDIATAQLLRAASSGRESNRSWRTFYRTPASLWAHQDSKLVCPILRKASGRPLGTSGTHFINGLTAQLKCESV